MREHEAQLASTSHTLHFQLHRLCFIQLLCAARVPDALAYATAHFPALPAVHRPAVQRLMGALLFPGARLATSPYADLAIWGTDQAWAAVASAFDAEYDLIFLSPLGFLSVPLTPPTKGA